MLDDIDLAKDYIFLETYRIGNDSIGIRFKEIPITPMRILNALKTKNN